MTLSELLESATWAETKAALLWSYPDAARSLEGYRCTLGKLRALAPFESNMRIILKEAFEEGLNDQPSIEVVGRNGQLNRDQADFRHLSYSVDSEYATSETDFCLSFEPWKYWLGMRIDAGTLSRFTPPQIAAHCLWDMTFHGFEQWQVKEVMEEINRRADEVAAMSEEERKRNLIPMEEVVRKFDLPRAKQ
jgi:hypothetical protein